MGEGVPGLAVSFLSRGGVRDIGKSTTDNFPRQNFKKFLDKDSRLERKILVICVLVGN